MQHEIFPAKKQKYQCEIKKKTMSFITYSREVKHLVEMNSCLFIPGLYW